MAGAEWWIAQNYFGTQRDAHRTKSRKAVIDMKGFLWGFAAISIQHLYYTGQRGYISRHIERADFEIPSKSKTVRTFKKNPFYSVSRTTLPFLANIFSPICMRATNIRWTRKHYLYTRWPVLKAWSKYLREETDYYTNVANVETDFSPADCVTMLLLLSSVRSIIALFNALLSPFVYHRVLYIEKFGDTTNERRKRYIEEKRVDT